jgi:hypothetical protein
MALRIRNQERRRRSWRDSLSKCACLTLLGRKSLAAKFTCGNVATSDFTRRRPARRDRRPSASAPGDGLNYLCRMPRRSAARGAAVESDGEELDGPPHRH